MWGWHFIERWGSHSLFLILGWSQLKRYYIMLRLSHWNIMHLFLDPWGPSPLGPSHYAEWWRWSHLEESWSTASTRMLADGQQASVRHESEFLVVPAAIYQVTPSLWATLATKSSNELSLLSTAQFEDNEQNNNWLFKATEYTVACYAAKES